PDPIHDHAGRQRIPGIDQSLGQLKTSTLAPKRPLAPWRDDRRCLSRDRAAWLRGISTDEDPWFLMEFRIQKDHGSWCRIGRLGRQTIQLAHLPRKGILLGT